MLLFGTGLGESDSEQELGFSVAGAGNLQPKMHQPHFAGEYHVGKLKERRTEYAAVMAGFGQVVDRPRTQRIRRQGIRLESRVNGNPRLDQISFRTSFILKSRDYLCGAGGQM